MKSQVFFTSQITPDSLIKLYEALGIKPTGKVGVKVSTGEQGAKGYLKADLISPLVTQLHGTILECNTAYPGSRNFTPDHLATAKSHGFDFAEIDIMDADGDLKIPAPEGARHLQYDLIGSHFANYDSFLNLAHGKGHMMGGFGANLKNQSIGIASRNGKAYIHSCGQTEDPDACWKAKYAQIDFIESMAEAAKAVADYCASNQKPILYITVMNALSTSCDCDANQDDPVMPDLGIIGSLDPVANDQAFLDLIWKFAEENPTHSGVKKLQDRITSREGEKITAYAASLGLGSTAYALISLD